MSLVVEDGTGMATAEAFGSVADAEAYFAAWGTPTGWATATTAAKETALRKGARALEAWYRARFVGRRKNETQALSWPRYMPYPANLVAPNDYGMTENRRWWPDNVIPTPVAQANFVLAGEVIGGTDLQPNITDTPGVTSESVSVGEISRSVSYTGGKQLRPIRQVIDGLLAEVLSPVDRAVRC